MWGEQTGIEIQIFVIHTTAAGIINKLQILEKMQIPQIVLLISWLPFITQRLFCIQNEQEAPCRDSFVEADIFAGSFRLRHNDITSFSR